jgi:CrcB protein
VPAPLLVFLGGAAGGLARYAVTSAWPAGGLGFPWATLVVNISGAFALGLLLGSGGTPQHGARHDVRRLLLGTGFLGAWTTFSALAISTDRLLAHDRVVAGVAYLVLTVVAGLVAAEGGRRLSARP